MNIFSRSGLFLCWLFWAACTQAAEFGVIIRNFTFIPSILAVQIGDRVTWSNEDSIAHTTTSDTVGWDSGLLGQGQSFSTIFNQAGNYPYHCEPHPTMRASITVQEVNQGKPNLLPFWLTGWSDSLVISTTPGGHIDSTRILENERINVAFAVVNVSTTNDVTQDFIVRIFIDGLERFDWLRPGLSRDTWNSTDINDIGPLSVGTHTIRMVVDATDVVDESNESDNVYEKQFVVQSADSTSGTGVTISNFSFQPANLIVPVGATVTWTNQDTVAHTTTSDSGVWSSTLLSQGQTFSFTFNQPGTYPYHCEPHPNMRATITVQEGVSDKPNLLPFWLNTWSDSLVVSTTPGGHVDSTDIRENQNINVAFAVANLSTNIDVTQDFVVRILIDGQERLNWLRPGLIRDTWNSTDTNDLGALPAGTHTIRIVVDATQVVDESNEDDNIYEKQFVVRSSSSTHTNPVVRISTFSFQPFNLVVPVGATVTWTNLDAVSHTSTSDTGVWISGLLSQGQSFSFTFNQAGTYPYRCEPHPNMRASVTVEGPSSGAVTLASPKRRPDGSIQFAISSNLGAQLTIQTSTNLTSWATLQEVINPTGNYLFQDTNVINAPQRFYRVRLP